MNLNNLLTEVDNATGCPVRVCALLGFAAYLAGSAYTTVHNGSFDYAAFANSLWPVLLAVGASISGKMYMELKGQPNA